jgi:hypothetical protein
MPDYADRAAERIGDRTAEMDVFLNEESIAAIIRQEVERANLLTAEQWSQQMDRIVEVSRLRGVLKHSHDRCWRQAELLKRAMAHIEKTQSLYKEIHEELYPPPDVEIGS